MLDKQKRKSNYKEILTGYVFASPWILSFLFLFLVPFVFLVYLSLTDARTSSIIMNFQGLKNFRNIFIDIFIDRELGRQIMHTLIYVFLSVPVNMIFSLFLAMLLHTNVKGTKVFRVVFYLPTLVTIVAVALLWQYILNYNGILNTLLKFAGIQGPDWLKNDFWALPSLVIMGTWSVGGVVVLFVAGLTDVPVTLYEAADIDGASSVSKFFKITLPMLSPIIFYNLLMAVIAAFQVFAQPMLMTQGQYNTKFLGFVIYDTAFGQGGRIGYASAQSLVLLAIVMIFVAIIKRIEKKLIFYND
jgi:multiple sugar transport system permease protein